MKMGAGRLSGYDETHPSLPSRVAPSIILCQARGDVLRDMVTDEDLTTPFVQTVLFAVTTRCNLRCTYCAVSLPGYSGEDFDVAGFDRLVDGFAKASVNLVQISGHGETTMIPGWERLCEALL